MARLIEEQPGINSFQAVVSVVAAVLVVILWRMGHPHVPVMTVVPNPTVPRAAPAATPTLPTVTVGNEVVRYTNGASAADAQAVGDMLSSLRFSRDHKTQIQVSKPAGHYLVSFPAWGKSKDDVPWISDMLWITMDISNHKFGGVPVDMDLVDQQWQPRQHYTLAMNHAVPFHNMKAQDGLVWYGDDVTPQEAARVAAAMGQTMQNQDVGLSKSADGKYTLWTMWASGWDTPKMETWVRYLATEVSQQGIRPIQTVQIAGEGFYPHKKLAL
ncbi:MAG TPA: hypothetical protein VGO93_12895 [Candidatus Xenobia bacterium]|jgi:hypothetical protein